MRSVKRLALVFPLPGSQAHGREETQKSASRLVCGAGSLMLLAYAKTGEGLYEAAKRDQTLFICRKRRFSRVPEEWMKYGSAWGDEFCCWMGGKETGQRQILKAINRH